jgi:hypothetical protein
MPSSSSPSRRKPITIPAMRGAEVMNELAISG